MATDPDDLNATENYSIWDTDSDTYYNAYDLDSENDGIFDLREAGWVNIDQDNYGTVHKMKGVGGTFKFPLITDVAVEILKIFTVEAKTASLTINEVQGNAVLDLIEKMKSHVMEYKKEMGM